MKVEITGIKSVVYAIGIEMYGHRKDVKEFRNELKSIFSGGGLLKQSKEKDSKDPKTKDDMKTSIRYFDYRKVSISRVKASFSKLLEDYEVANPRRTNIFEVRKKFEAAKKTFGAANSMPLILFLRGEEGLEIGTRYGDLWCDGDFEGLGNDDVRDKFEECADVMRFNEPSAIAKDKTGSFRFPVASGSYKSLLEFLKGKHIPFKKHISVES